MTAWRLAELGGSVDLFERDTLMGATSSASTKLLHGGVRYLEQGEFRLVRESLHERTWWVKQAPQFAHPIRLLLPIPRAHSIVGGRPRWLVGLGLTLYDVLAGSHTFGRHHWHSAREVVSMLPHLRMETFAGAYSFFDAQMDDHALGLWAADQAREAGVRVHEHTRVDRVSSDGRMTIAGESTQYDAVVNVAGPWAARLLEDSDVRADHTLDLVRGSHLLLRGSIEAGVLVQVPGERRVCFVLPYKGNTLLGTTEVRQTLHDPIVCSAEEQQYLLGVYNATFADTKTDADIIGTFAGVRPLLRSAADPTRATREYVVEREGQLVTVFGGKWTTSRALARHVARVVEGVVQSIVRFSSLDRDAHALG
jgi:glycerol-3-phosphate dehydrogenase